MFEALILHVSLRKAPAKQRYQFYSHTMLRFNKVTGLAATSTIYFGVMLATIIDLGSIAPLVTTPWGILSTIFAISLLIGLLVPLKPETISRLFNLGVGAASAAVIAVLASIAFSLELKNLPSSDWGIAILAGGTLAVGLLAIGASQGTKRVQLAILSSQALSDDVQQVELYKKLEIIERKMLRMIIPENLVALAVIALMVYAANPF